MRSIDAPRLNGRATQPVTVGDAWGAGERVARPVRGLRPVVRGTSLWLAVDKLTVHGVTYGPLRSRPGASDGWDPAVVRRDFAAMVAHGANAVRTYTVPPAWMLDEALEAGLFVLVGVPWEQHIDFLGEHRAQLIADAVRTAARGCAGHPALLAIAVGNEIPAGVVRWLGRRRVEQFLGRLCRIVHEEDPEALVTYVNYPSTEYLRLPAADLLAANVYLERGESFRRYLARLQNLADDRPLLLAEIGLDSARNGDGPQAELLTDQVGAVLTAGAAGSFVFAWTDEWERGGAEISGWAFGITTRAREPRDALARLSALWSSPVPEPPARSPKISVVVCTYNGAATLDDCLQGIARLRYPNHEVLVVDDGSTDGSAALARKHGVRVISTPNRGLSSARNTGAAHTDGDVIAYIDDDATPDPDWLTYLARGFEQSEVTGAGGPNVLPPGSGSVATCVANAPGGPTHVLLNDTDAEHLPGCNLAVRRSAFDAIGGFDERFRVAGDDVDLCWRLLDAGGRLAFCPGAVVEHRRRDSVRGYLRQQRGYGRAEALLERKWPERYSASGQIDWAGRLYGNGSAQHRGGWRWRVYYGSWGSASFQSLYGPRSGLLQSVPLMPEWWLLIGALSAVSVAGLWVRPLLVALPLLIAATGAMVLDAALGATRARLPDQMSRRRRLRLRALTAMLYLLQPQARLAGRLGTGLSPWRRLGPRGADFPRARRWVRVCPVWRDPLDRVRALSWAIENEGAVVRSGGDWDRFDAGVRSGMFGGVRVLSLVEEHGHGQQVLRVRCRPHFSGVLISMLIAVAVFAAVLLVSGQTAIAAALLAPLGLLAVRGGVESGRATRAVGRAIEGLSE